MKQAFYQGKSFNFPDDFTDEEIAKSLPGLYDQVKPTAGDVVAAIPEVTAREFFQKPAVNLKRLGKDLVGMDTTAEKQQVEEIDQRLRSLTQDFDLTDQMLLYGGSSALGSLPAGVAGGVRAAGALAKGATALEAGRKGLGTATTIGAAPQGLNTYGENRDAGFSIPRSLTHAAIDFAIEKYTEYLPGSKLLESGGKPFWKSMGQFLGRDLTGEEIATVTQDLNAMMSTRPDMTLKDIAEHMLVTAGATAIAGPLQGGMMRGVQALLPGGTAPAAAAPGGTPPAAPAVTPPAAADPTAGLVKPAGATVEPAVAGTLPTPQSDELAKQDELLRAAEAGPMVKLYAVVPNDTTVDGEILAVPGDRAAAVQLLAQAGGQGRILEADMPQSQLDQLLSTQAGDAEIQKQKFFGTEVSVPASIFFGPSASSPTGAVSPAASPPVESAGTTTAASPAEGTSALSSPSLPQVPPTAGGEVVQPPTPAPLPTEKKATPARRVSMKFGKSAPKVVEFATDQDKTSFSIVTGLRKLVRAAMSDQQRATVGRMVEVETQRFMKLMGETDQATATRVLGLWHEQVVAQVRAAPEGQPVKVEALDQANYQRLKEVVEGKRPPPQKEAVAIADEHRDDPHVRRMAKLVEKWISIFSPGLKVKIVGVGQLTGIRGLASPSVDGFNLVVPNPGHSNAVQLAILAHEFGHMLFDMVLRNPKYSDQLLRMRADYEQAKKDAETMKAIDWIKKYRNLSTIREWKTAKETYNLTDESMAMDYIAALDRRHKQVYTEKYGEEAYARWRNENTSYGLLFHEFAADQVSRYVAKGGERFIPEDMKGFFDAIIAAMKTFYERVVKRFKIAPSFQKWMEQMESGDYLEFMRLAEKVESGELQKEFLAISEEVDRYTTKVLNRLPAKERLKKVTIAAEINRPDVRENERELLARVLGELPGDTVDAQEFKRKVLEKVVPLTVKAHTKLASTGMFNAAISGLGFLKFDGAAATARSYVFEWPYETPKFINSHFSGISPKYFAHARVWFAKKINDRSPYVVELQSDWTLSTDQKRQLQKAEKTAGGFVGQTDPYGVEAVKSLSYERKIQFITALDEVMIIPRNTDDDVVVGHIIAGVRDRAYQGLRGSLEYNTRFVQEQIGTELDAQAALDEAEEKIFTQLDRINEIAFNPTELSVSIQAAFDPKYLTPAELDVWEKLLGAIHDGYRSVVGHQDQGFVDATDALTALKLRESLSGVLPKHWWQLVTRQLLRQFAVDGIRGTARFATPSMVVMVEGHAAVNYETGAAEDEGDLDPSEFLSDVDWATLSQEDRKALIVEGAENNGAVDPFSQGYTLTPDGKYLLYPGTEGVYNFYRKELVPFLQKELGGQLITDEEGGEWVEVPIPGNPDIPVEYFNLDEGVKSAVDSLPPPGQGGPDFGARETFKGFLTNALQINQLAKIFPEVAGLQRFRRTMQKMFAMKNRLLVEPNQRIVQWYGLGRPVARKMESLLMDEVNGGVHFTQLTEVKTATGATIHVHQPTERLREEAKKRGLSDEAIRTYLGVKNDFASMLDVMERMLMESVNRYFGKNPILAQIRRLEVKAEFDRFRSKPYFSDRGFGPWSVMVHARRDMTIEGREFKKGELLYWRKFENERAQKRHFKEMQGKIPTSDANISASFVEDLPYVLRGLPANFTQIMVDELGLSPEQLEKLQQIRYDASKEGAFLKLLEKGKKGVGGGSTDLRRVYADYFWRTSNFVSKMFFSDEVNAALSDVHRQALEVRQAGGNSNLLDMLHERLAQKKDYVFNPQSEWEVFRMWVSLWYLWGVPKTALMNISSVPTVGYAYLGARFGERLTVPAMLRAIKDATLTIRDPAGAKLSEEDHWALQRALDDGTSDQSFAAELAAVTDANALERLVPWSEWGQDSQAADSVRQVAWKAIWMGMLPFRAIEGVNRRTILLAAFRLNLEKGLSKEEAYQEAKDAVDHTQNDYSPWNKPKFLEGKKSAFLIFFSFVQNMAFNLYGGDKGWWRALMVLAALGGIYALPGMENLMDMLNWAWKKMSGEHVDLRVEAHRLAKEIGANPELVLHGALHAQGFLGWDTSGSISLGRIIPGTEAVFGEGKFNDRFVHGVSEAGGPAASLLVSGLRAMMDDTDPSALQRWEKVMPTAFRNLYRASQMWEQDAILDTQRRMLVPDVTGAEILGQAAGFQPVRKVERQELLALQRDAAEYHRIRRENLLSRLWKAKQAGDVKEEAAAEDAIEKYNSTVPDWSLEITQSSIRQSMKSREKALREVEEGMPPEKRYRAVYEDVESALRKE